MPFGRKQAPVQGPAEYEPALLCTAAARQTKQSSRTLQLRKTRYALVAFSLLLARVTSGHLRWLTQLRHGAGTLPRKGATALEWSLVRAV